MTEDQTYERLLYPKQHTDWALSHARAYAEELYHNNDYTEIWGHTNSIDKLAEYLDPRQEKQMRGFYEAMLKVVPHIEYPEHQDTEDRGWYRVWGAIKYKTGYFERFDMHRDNAMALDFKEHGAISDDEYFAYISHQAEQLKQEQEKKK